MKKIIAILSLVCFTTISMSSYAGGEAKDAKPACCQKGGEGKACCKDAKECSQDKKSCSKDCKEQKSCSGDAKAAAPSREAKKETK